MYGRRADAASMKPATRWSRTPLGSWMPARVTCAVHSRWIGPLIAVMQGAVEAGNEPFASALELNERLFTKQKIHWASSTPFPQARCRAASGWIWSGRALLGRRGGDSQ